MNKLRLTGVNFAAKIRENDNTGTALGRVIDKLLPLYNDNIYYRAQCTDGPALPGYKCAYIHEAPYKMTFPAVKTLKNIKLDYTSYRSKIWRYGEEKQNAVVFKANDSSSAQAIFYPDTYVLVINYGVLESFCNDVIAYIAEYYNFQSNEETGNATSVDELHEGKVLPTLVLPSRINVTIGCDPEFEIVLGGCVRTPGSFYTRNSGGPIGVDGAGSQIELRPKPGDIQTVLTSLSDLMGQLPDPISAIGDCAPLGGHIHVGVNNYATPPRELLFILDKMLGEVTLPYSGKARGNYSKPSAYESKNWGFEYRTPPAMIFANPVIAELALRICANVTESYVNRRVFLVSGQVGDFEDYFNYAKFTKKDYETWIGELEAYKAILADPKRYEINFAHFWSPSAQATTTTTSDTGPKEEPRDIDEASPAAQAMARTATDALENMGIRLSDEWAATIRREFADAFRHAITIRGPLVREISLYGLSASRGRVFSGLNVPNYENIAGYVDNRCYGIPRFIRTGRAVQNRELIWQIVDILMSINKGA
jgi:hypothetical protein